MDDLKLVNSLIIDTLYGSKEFTLMHGDISQMQADLLVFSTHTDKSELEGAVLDSLTKHYGELDFHSMLKVFSLTEDSYFKVKAVHPMYDNYSVPFDIYFLDSPKNMPFKGMIMIKIPSPAYFSTLEESLLAYQKAIMGIFSSMAILEFNGLRFKTIALPLLGGTRLYPKSKIMSTILDNSIKWLNYSAHTEQVFFAVYEDEQIQTWNSVMNSSLGRKVLKRNEYENAITALRSTLKERSITYMNAISNKNIHEILNSLTKALTSDEDIYIEQLGMYGRKLAEVITTQICHDLDIKGKHNTFQNIESISKSNHISKWVSNYLHCLRILGNESVHVTEHKWQRIPERLNEGDLLVMLSNILRVLDFYILWQNSTSG